MFTLNFEQILIMLFVTNEETSDTTNVLFVQKVSIKLLDFCIRTQLFHNIFTANLLKNIYCVIEICLIFKLGTPALGQCVWFLEIVFIRLKIFMYICMYVCIYVCVCMKVNPLAMLAYMIIINTIPLRNCKKAYAC